MRNKSGNPYNTIDYWLKQVKAQGFPARTVEDIDQAILRIYCRTRSMQKTSQALGVSANTIRTHLIRLGQSLQPRGGNNNPAGWGGRRRRLLTYHGEILSVSEWGRKMGIHHMTIRTRLDTLGWSVEQALTTPVCRAKSRKGSPQRRKVRREKKHKGETYDDI